MPNYLQGTNGQLKVFEDHLEISRGGFLAKCTHWKSNGTYIKYSDITSIKYRPGVGFISGYLYFMITGCDCDCNLIQSAQHENSIVFRSYNNGKAKSIKEYIEKKMQSV